MFEPGCVREVTKRDQEIGKAIFQKLLFLKYHSIKAKPPPRLRRFLTLLFHFTAPISLSILYVQINFIKIK
jgi:hypothetical protein